MTAPQDFWAAVQAGSIAEVTQRLDADPALVNARDENGLSAAFFGHTGTVEHLLQKGAQVNSPSRNSMRVMPLHAAIANQRTEIVQLLLDHGADVNATQADDFAPLHEAAQNGMLDVTQWLLDRGADINLRLSSSGKTPLALALEHHHDEVAQLLKRHGAVE